MFGSGSYFEQIVTLLQPLFQSFSAIDSCLQTAADSVHEQNPVYARLPKEVIAAMETVQQIKGPQLNNMTEVAISLRENHEEVFGPALSTYKKLLELMDILVSNSFLI